MTLEINFLHEYEILTQSMDWNLCVLILMQDRGPIHLMCSSTRWLLLLTPIQFSYKYSSPKSRESGEWKLKEIISNWWIFIHVKWMLNFVLDKWMNYWKKALFMFKAILF